MSLPYSVVLGLNIALALGSGSIGTGCTTMFVCLAEDPQVVAQRDPQLFEALRQAYPRECTLCFIERCLSLVCPCRGYSSCRPLILLHGARSRSR